MKKWLIILILTVMGLSFGITSSLQANTNRKMYFHYYRFDQNYQDINIHTWWENSTSSVNFSVENPLDFLIGGQDWSFGGVVSSINVGDYFGNVGFILNRQTTKEFDSTKDRFCDTKWVQKDANDNYHVYLVGGEEKFGISLEDKNNNLPDKRILGDATLTKGEDYQENLHEIQAINTIRLHFNYSTNYQIEVKDSLDHLLKSVSGSASDLIINFPTYAFDLEKIYFLNIIYPNLQKNEKRQISLIDLYDTYEFNQTFNYQGKLGYYPEGNNVVFHLWAPNTLEVKLFLYQDDANQSQIKTIHNLNYLGGGLWEIKLNSLLAFDKYYTYQIIRSFEAPKELVDPYTFSAGINGLRGYVVNFMAINNSELNWASVQRPQTINNWADYSVYELHVRDLTSSDTWEGPNEYRAKFKGLSVAGTTYTQNGTTVTTGLDHIKELGVNAIQLLPIFDNAIIDETRLNDPTYNSFNWGYMPLNFNSLEGSYATEQDGLTKVIEFKETMKDLGNEGLRVIMDVVYNHTGYTYNSNFYQILPGYYHRHDENGLFYNGSGCLNETASDRPMMRKFIKDSLYFYATEYNLSGFRFDLMGLHDVQTMNEIQEMLAQVDPTIVIYGEPWHGGNDGANNIINGRNPASGIANPHYKAFDASNLSTYPANYNHLDVLKVGSFNDTTRDALKGNPDGTSMGWINGNATDLNKNKILYGINGATEVLGLGESKPQPSSIPHNPNLIVNYVSAHDNFTLRDKIWRTWLANNGTPPSAQQLSSLSVLASGTVILSQGIAFIHAGEEILRTKIKPGYNDLNSESARDSYDQPDLVNQLRWDEKIAYYTTFLQYQELLGIRHQKAFHLAEANKIFNSLAYDYEMNIPWSSSTIAFKIFDEDQTQTIVIISSGGDVALNLGDKNYEIINPLSSAQTGLYTGDFLAYGWHITILKETTNIVTLHWGVNFEYQITKEVPTDGVLFTPFDPNVEGYQMDGWYLEEQLINPLNTTINSNLELWAKYTQIFNCEVHSSYAKSFQAPSNFIIDPLLSDPIIENFIFLGWYLDEELQQSLSANYHLLANIHLYPKYLMNIDIVDDQKDENGKVILDDAGHVLWTNKSYIGSEIMVKLRHSLLKDQYFMGFYLDKDYEHEALIIKEDTIIFSKYGIIVKVVTNIAENQYVEYLLSAQGTSIKYLDPPAYQNKRGLAYTFVGWYLDRRLTKKADMSTLIDKNLTLYPRYKFIPYIHPLVLSLIVVLGVGIISTTVVLIKKYQKKGEKNG
ncbi:MAG: InlB B-repeat-containing protein [Acholeplasmatales bacterium]|jgi:pullulanase|nr:InlB B-repeat-containing protein [Acholeplasmatales bacterium]